ncbi:MAG: NAC family transcription factor, partial [Methanomicrobiaceae archaeon]|nr:NAC family transcription factor [Methanomicrobiaceae archaeon]
RYCTVCGGVVPQGIDIRTISVDGKETGIHHLDRILDDVAALGLRDPARIGEELLTRVRACNYVPMKKADAYREALLREYRDRAAEGGGGD